MKIATTFLLSLFISLLLCVSAFAQSDEDIHFFDPDFVFEVVDPGFCEMPPPSAFPDSDIIDMMNSRRDEIPLQGEITGPLSGTVFGVGYYKIHSDGLTASFSNMILTPDGRVLSLCMVILPVNDTTLIEGTAVLAGPAPESVDGPTYLAITRISQRDDEAGLIPIGELIGGKGSITFIYPEDGVLEGNLEIDGRIEGISENGQQNDINLSFYFEEMIENPLRNLRWSLNDF
jgi:hypothetical protein